MNTTPIPGAHPASSDTFLDRIGRLVAPPLETLGSRGTLVTPLILVLALSAVSAAGLHGPVTASGTSAVSGNTLWVLAVLSPLVALAKGLFLTTMAWALLVLCGAPTGFRRVLSAVLYGEVVLSLQNVWIAGVVLARGHFDAGAPVHVGLDALVGTTHPVLLQVARGVTPFHAAWVVFLTFALTGPRETPRWKGALVACALWSATAGLVALRASLA